MNFAKIVAALSVLAVGLSCGLTPQISSAAAAPPAAAATGQAAAPTLAPQTGADPAVIAAFAKLKEGAFAGKANNDDVAGALAYYAERSSAAWVGKDGLNANAKAAVDEMKKAADWGLDASEFALPDANANVSTPDAAGEAEAKLSLAVLTYARHARGGRIPLATLSRILDLKPPLKDPKAVLSEIASASSASDYLIGLHPKHEQFVRLRQALLKAQGPAEPEKPIDEAFLIKLPDGPTIKPGSLHPDIALLRKRLKVPADFSGRDTLYDEKLTEAVKVFQSDKGLKSTGQINQRTRAALNGEGVKKKPDKARDVQRIAINMERWRWMPEELGSLHIWNNIPEYTTRTLKDGKVLFKERIIVGQPTWPTPVFSAQMKTIVFNPSWGVPDGIKQKELKPRLQKAGGGGFFDQLFGGGGGGGGVIRAYGLTPYINGRPIDPDSVNWASADLRKYSFIQPPGAKNPLGVVKFLFPNPHDVYMHDTTQRNLFASSSRPFSHGCIRVQNPMQLAEVLIAQDRGWAADKVASAVSSGGDFVLEKPFPVHSTYMTAVVDEAGNVSTFGDVYGHDSRLAAALGSKVRDFDSGVSGSDIETASVAAEEDAAADTGEPKPAKKRKGQVEKKSKTSYRMPESIGEAMSGLVAN